jgi:hypothetical protein
MTAPKPSVFVAAVGHAVLLHAEEQQEQTAVFEAAILTPLFLSLLVDLVQLRTPWELLCMVIVNSL